MVLSGQKKYEAHYERLVEKPTPEDAPSNLESIRRYVLTPNIFERLRTQLPGVGGEIQLANAINAPTNHGGVDAVELRVKRFDCGSVDGYLEAIFHMAQNRKS